MIPLIDLDAGIIRFRLDEKERAAWPIFLAEAQGNSQLLRLVDRPTGALLFKKQEICFQCCYKPAQHVLWEKDDTALRLEDDSIVLVNHGGRPEVITKATAIMAYFSSEAIGMPSEACLSQPELPAMA